MKAVQCTDVTNDIPVTNDLFKNLQVADSSQAHSLGIASVFVGGHDGSLRLSTLSVSCLVMTLELLNPSGITLRLHIHLSFFVSNQYTCDQSNS